MELLERGREAAALSRALSTASDGRGSVALVTGEAGAGKTALLRAFAEQQTLTRRSLWGVCDDLIAPRPLGPLRDLLAQTGASPYRSTTEVLDAIMATLNRPPHPSLLIVEDAQWADEATLDGLRFLTRRISRLPALLVISFRDDETSAGHPLRRTLGSIPPADVMRLPLAALSRAAVAKLAGHDDITELYELTGGNPFYVTELLVSEPERGSLLPGAVQDAIMARVGMLSPSGRSCAETASVVPGRVERWVLDECSTPGTVDEVARVGLVQVDDAMVWFSHELDRRAVEASLPIARRRSLNRQVLEILARADVEPSRLAHHSLKAEEPSAIARYAPVAAREAAALDAHREAMNLFQHALKVSAEFAPADLAHVLQDHAAECAHYGRYADAAASLRSAVDLYAELVDDKAKAVCLLELSDAVWHVGDGELARGLASQAATILERESSGADLGRVYAHLAKLELVDHRFAQAQSLGSAALTHARESADRRTLAHAMTTVGYAEWMQSPSDHSRLEDSLHYALRHNLLHEATRAYFDLVAGAIEHADFRYAESVLADALVFAEEHDLSGIQHLLLTHRATCRLERGQWDDAWEDSQTAAAAGALAEREAYHNLLLVAIRRGTPSVTPLLERAEELDHRSGDVQDLLPLGLARLEHAWLSADFATFRTLAPQVYDLARDAPSPRLLGRAAVFAAQAGLGDGRRPPGQLPEPYQAILDGRWEHAAACWSSMGCQYSAAEALAFAGSPDCQARAIEIALRLGAKPLAALLRERLATLGVDHIPRGPNLSTRQNPAGLTARQSEVLALLAQGLTYEQIAGRLHVSVKTVDHHASAVRMKLDVTTRDDAVEVGRRRGLIA